MSTLKLIEAAANSNHGITLQPRQVRTLAGFIMDLQSRQDWLHNMLVAYMNEYSPELFYELTQDDIVEGEVEEDNAEDSGNTSSDERGDGDESRDERNNEVKDESEGQVQASPGLHSQMAEGTEGDVEVFENRGWGEDEGRTDGPYIY